ANYKDNIELTKSLFRHVAKEIYGTTVFETRGHKFDLAGEWEEIDYAQAIKDAHGIDIFTASDEQLKKAIDKAGIKLSGELNRNRMIDNLWKHIRKNIAGPAVLVNEPKFMSPLAKSKPENEQLTERYHIVIAGSELANGYSEINDPIDQLNRFVEQEGLREAGDDEAQMLDIDFVEMLEYGMPPTSGHGHSERLFWYFENVTAREGTLFPLLKENVDEITKKIYGDIVRENSVVNATKETGDKQVQDNSTDSSLDYPSISEAEKLMLDNVSDTYQRLHSYMVSKIMEGYAKELGKEDEAELWAITGLIHDWDYGFDPEGHPEGNIEKLTEMEYPASVTEAILAHKPRLREPRTTKMASALLAIDELAGLLFAYNKFKGGYENMNAKSVQKKFKDKAFAAKVNRDDIKLGLEDLGIEVREHIEKVLSILTSSNPRFDDKIAELSAALDT
ncbi:MAG: amino acid--tRNA ligase-related protein, partial [Candidatus Dojkabacteria bacterium]